MTEQIKTNSEKIKLTEPADEMSEDLSDIDIDQIEQIGLDIDESKRAFKKSVSIHLDKYREKMGMDRRYGIVNLDIENDIRFNHQEYDSLIFNIIEEAKKEDGSPYSVFEILTEQFQKGEHYTYGMGNAHLLQLALRNKKIAEALIDLAQDSVSNDKLPETELLSTKNPFYFAEKIGWLSIALNQKQFSECFGSAIERGISLDSKKINLDQLNKALTDTIRAAKLCLKFSELVNVNNVLKNILTKKEIILYMDNTPQREKMNEIKSEFDNYIQICKDLPLDECFQQDAFGLDLDGVPTMKRDRGVTEYAAMLDLDKNNFLSKTILDLGAGEGLFAKEINAYYRNSRAVSIEPFIFQGQDDSQFIKASSGNIPAKSEAFDLVVATFSTPLYCRNANEMEMTIKETARVLKPDGEARLSPFRGSNEKNGRQLLNLADFEILLDELQQKENVTAKIFIGDSICKGYSNKRSDPLEVVSLHKSSSERTN